MVNKGLARARSQPEAKGPGRGQRRATGEGRVVGQDLFGRGAIDQEILQGLARHAELHALGVPTLRGAAERGASEATSKETRSGWLIKTP